MAYVEGRIKANRIQFYPVLSVIDPFDLFDLPPSSFHHLLFSSPPDLEPLLRLVTIDKPELTPFLPPPGKVFDCSGPCPCPSSLSPSPLSSPAVLLGRFRFFDTDPCSLKGLIPFSH